MLPLWGIFSSPGLLVHTTCNATHFHHHLSQKLQNYRKLNRDHTKALVNGDGQKHFLKYNDIIVENQLVLKMINKQHT